MKNRNKIMKRESIKIKKRNIRVEHKKLHRNCKYDGKWENWKNLITIDSNIDSKKYEQEVKTHEYIHAALCTFVQSLDPEKDEKQIEALCSICDSLESNTKLHRELRKYGVG